MKEPDMRTMFFKQLPLSSQVLMRAFASITSLVAVAAMLAFPTQTLAQSDVTQPTDPIQLENGVNDGDGSAGAPPAAEGVDKSLDNTTTKYLNFLDLGSGFSVQPQVGLTIVTGLRLYTANDAVDRDPASYQIEGGNSLAGPWTVISSGALALPATRNPGGQPLSAALAQQTVTFPNTTPYAAYRVTFPTLKNAAAANSMQIGEVELLGAQKPATLADFIQLGRTRVGSIEYNGATTGGEGYTIVGGGADTWDRTDELAFGYHQVAGDFDIRVQVTEIQASGQWSKAGIMVRESLAEDSKRVMQSVSPCGLTAQGVNGACAREFLWRTGILNVDGENGGSHAVSVGTPNYPNAWIRLVREGSSFTGYGSDNGVDWTLITSQDSSTWQGGALPGKVWVGLSVSRHPAAGVDRCRTVFRNYTETTTRFGMVADSQGCPDKIFLCFNRPYGPSALDINNYTFVATDVFPVSVEAGPNPNTVCVIMEPMTEGYNYQVQATPNVLDADGNAVDGASALGSFIHAKGYELRRIHVQHNKNYHDPANDSLAARLDSTAYRLGQGAWTQGSPPHEGNTVFEDPIVDAGTNERFSSVVVGVLSPAADMNAIFAMSSDDEGRTYLGSNDQPSSKVEIAREPAWNGRREYAAGGNQATRGTPPVNISAPQALVANSKYYLEVVFSEGGGGNNGSVTWDAGTGAAFVNGQTPIEEANFLPSRFAWGHIFYTLGAPQVIAQPQDLTVNFGSPASFSVGLDGTPPYRVTWKKNGAVIPGQTGTTLTIAAAAESDNGATIEATIANACGEATTESATLTVLLNPIISSVTSRGNCHAIFVNWNQPMALDGTYSMICSNHADGTIAPVTLSNIRHGSSTSQIRFDVSPDLLPDTNTYYLTVTGANSAGALLQNPDPATVAFIHGSEYPAWNVMVRQYNDVGNGNLANFLNSAKVVNDTPDLVELNPTGFFEARSNIRENYGSRVLGYYVAPQDGNYQFWSSADDQSATYIATDANPANKVQITAEPAWGGIRAFAQGQVGQADPNGGRGSPPIYNPPTSITGNGSLLIPLTAGQRVYLEGVFTEGGGGDNYAATVVIDPVDPNVPPANGTLPIPQSAFTQQRIAPDGTPFNTLCDVFCSPGPTDQTVFIGQSATFRATADGTPPYSYQWKKDGVVIPGATAASYTTPPATQADHGATYTFCVNNEFSTNDCSAVLNVRNEPRVVRCETRNHPINVYVTYNKPVQLDGTYTIDEIGQFPVDIISIAHGATMSEVVLTTGGLATDGDFILTITGVHDQEATPVGGNLLVPDPTICPFGQGPGRFCADFNDGLLPAGSVGSGTQAPFVADGVLKLTQNGVTSQQNFWTINLGGSQTLKCFEARWDSLLNGPIANGADGYSFSVGQDPNVATAEEGSANGLSVTVDTFDNGGLEVGIDIKWNGVRLGFTQIGGGGTAPAALMRNVFVPATLTVSPSGAVTFNYDTFTVSGQIPAFTGLVVNKYVFAARTGGASEDAWIDNVCINDFTLGDVTVAVAPVNPSLPECSPGITLTSTVGGSPCHFYQWSKNGVPIPGAVGKTLFTGPLLAADDGAVYTLTVSNEFSTASASTTIDVVLDTTAPAIVSVGALNVSSIGVCFSEAVQPASATTAANYSINGGAPGAGIAGVTLRPDGRSVVIALSTPLPNCLDFTVNSTGVLDACPATNSGPSSGTGSIVGLTSADVGTPGDPAAPGGSSVSCADGVVEIIARGGDMWGTVDHLHFAHAQVAGDFDVSVKVESLECTAQWAKAGLGARATLDADSAAITTYLNPLGPCGANQIESGARPATGLGMDGWNDVPYNGSGEVYPRPLASDFRWIRLQRIGNRFIAYHSVDGTPGSWIEHADSGPVPGTPLSLFVGLLATPNNGNNAAIPTKAIFSGFSLSTSLSVVPSGPDVVLSWTDPCAVLQAAPTISGPWVNVTGGSPQSFPAAGPMQYFRTIR